MICHFMVLKTFNDYLKIFGGRFIMNKKNLISFVISPPSISFKQTQNKIIYFVIVTPNKLSNKFSDFWRRVFFCVNYISKCTNLDQKTKQI